MSKIVINESLPILPSEVIDIIYDYYKPQYVDKISPVNKFLLKHVKGGCNRVAHHLKIYMLHKDYFRYTIYGAQSYTLTPYGCYFDSYCMNNRDNLKKLCRENGIEFKDRTPTKNLIKKLMKL